eukprot:CAMPEP_0198500172 /NCGR_PEP_ID=MMETSP1462-20131121/8029_1 /TAXON_ID=1333877 /ORGANISM="Brandtodinium nutriculum, Strain RCC3387" /LENGTH=108 /DNA_ID=CAMNT_0044229179 /DNA_START=83 /DNA_END=409 /DNA_ORIENTATION=-
MAASGTFKTFFHEKGWGFITPDDGSEDVFVHVKENGGDDMFAQVQVGDACTYDPQYEDRKGKWKAVNVTGPTIGGGGSNGGDYGGGYGKGKGGGKGGDRYSPYGGKGW